MLPVCESAARPYTADEERRAEHMATRQRRPAARRVAKARVQYSPRSPQSPSHPARAVYMDECVSCLVRMPEARRFRGTCILSPRSAPAPGSAARCPSCRRHRPVAGVPCPRDETRGLSSPARLPAFHQTSTPPRLTVEVGLVQMGVSGQRSRLPTRNRSSAAGVFTRFVQASLQRRPKAGHHVRH